MNPFISTMLYQRHVQLMMVGALGGGSSGQSGGGSVGPSLGLDLSGDSVKIPPALAGQATATILILLNDLQSLK